MSEEIIKKASELSKEYTITSHKDGYDVTVYPDVTMLYKMAEWMQKEFNLRDIRLDTIQCCEEYLAKFGTLDGVYEHYFADITEK